jgi:hypothetical protein
MKNPFTNEPEIGSTLRIHIPDYQQDDIDATRGIAQIVDRTYVWYRNFDGWYLAAHDVTGNWEDVCMDIDVATAVDVADWSQQ